jgi:REP element-mobilizing transposase RayT
MVTPGLEHHLITLVTRGRRPYLFDRDDVVADAIQQLGELEGVRVDHYRVTSHHLHLILTLPPQRWSIAAIVRRLKAATSRRAGGSLRCTRRRGGAGSAARGDRAARRWVGPYFSPPYAGVPATRALDVLDAW